MGDLSKSCYKGDDLQGAVYVTDNGAYTWQAAVQETVDGTLNRTVSSGEHYLPPIWSSWEWQLELTP